MEILCWCEKRIPIAFSDTVFKKHVAKMLNERGNYPFSNIFCLLPSITDKKEDQSAYEKHQRYSNRFLL